jgi:hypothetical protein
MYFRIRKSMTEATTTTSNGILLHQVTLKQKNEPCAISNRRDTKRCTLASGQAQAEK